ncbi:hypothetical protein CHS0354_027675 [Potamilus streckersoni]|uniref:Methyltransferase domain-containing protein n=1 Tax=Potamilus streckersoni TaxID=2493646 RepID=A0AAE0T0Y8_9BIVA|nr:hypothetical protein CHS0354_027675 [Potamilus streckersoni]
MWQNIYRTKPILFIFGCFILLCSAGYYIKTRAPCIVYSFTSTMATITQQPEQGKNVDFGNSLYQSPSSDIIMLPSKEKIRNMTHREVANLYHSYINSLQVLCRRVVRVGFLEDGGWEICEDSNYRPHRPCLVYSFGINYDYSFDDDIVRRYGCEVHSFDPSMRNESDHRRGALGYFHNLGLGDFNQVNPSGWQLKRLGTIQKELGHTNKKIDVLKMDIEEWEWRTIPDMLKSGALSNVQQFVTELHINLHFEPMEEAYKMGLSTLKDLYDEGFRIFWTHRNLWCKFMSRFVSEMRSGCHEVSFIKVT